MSKPNKELQNAIHAIVKNQMRDGTPPETKQTYDRLMAAGHSREETMRLIGCAVTTEIFDVLKENQNYDEQRYIAALEALPKLPQHDETGYAG